MSAAESEESRWPDFATASIRTHSIRKHRRPALELGDGRRVLPAGGLLRRRARVRHGPQMAHAREVSVRDRAWAVGRERPCRVETMPPRGTESGVPGFAHFARLRDSELEPPPDPDRPRRRRARRRRRGRRDRPRRATTPRSRQRGIVGPAAADGLRRPRRRARTPEPRQRRAEAELPPTEEDPEGADPGAERPAAGDERRAGRRERRPRLRPGPRPPGRRRRLPLLRRRTRSTGSISPRGGATCSGDRERPRSASSTAASRSGSSSQMTDDVSATVTGDAARVVATVFTVYADVREPTIEDDIIYLARDGRPLADRQAEPHPLPRGRRPGPAAVGAGGAVGATAGPRRPGSPASCPRGSSRRRASR